MKIENFAFKLIWLLIVSNLLPLEVVQKYQRCQLCALRENSIVMVLDKYCSG